jgi:dolichol-phosphate mannosyltransferase
MSTSTLDIIVPCFQEELGIERFHAALVAVMDSLSAIHWKVLYIDDGSTDGTLQTLNGLASRDSRINIYSFSRNFGHQVALSAGLSESTADASIIMDGDLQHPPEVIPLFWERYLTGYDIVSAVRETTEGVSWFKRHASSLFYSIINRLSDTRIEPGVADFCLLSRRAREALTQMPEQHRFLRGMIAWTGFSRTFVEFTAPARLSGVSKYTLWRMMRLALDAVFSFSTRPIRIILKIGLLMGVLGFIYLGSQIMRYLVYGDAVRGWPSLMALVCVIGGLQLFAIAVSGEYIARIFEECKRRPHYFFKQTPTARGRGSDCA